jgi:hypothetical protein
MNLHIQYVTNGFILDIEIDRKKTTEVYQDLNDLLERMKVLKTQYQNTN